MLDKSALKTVARCFNHIDINGDGAFRALQRAADRWPGSHPAIGLYRSRGETEK